MKISVKWPGKRAEDARATVTLEEPGTPWPIRFHFLDVYDDETDSREWVNVGFELGRAFLVPAEIPARTKVAEETLLPLDPAAVQRVAVNYAAYLAFARSALIFDQEGMAETQGLLGRSGKSARLTDDHYRLIAADYETRRAAGQKHIVTAIAAARYVDISTASRWVKEARRRGYLPPA